MLGCAAGARPTVGESCRVRGFRGWLTDGGGALFMAHEEV